MNMKKLVAGVMACCVISATVPSVSMVADNAVFTASAENEIAEYTEGTYGQLTYYNYGDYIEIVGCDKSATEVVIPAEIDGVPVTSIGAPAFCDCTNLTSIIIPDSVKSFGTLVFDGLPWFEEKIKENPLVIINGVIVDGRNCSGDVVIPDGIKCIPEYSFGYCSEMTSIVIPESVTDIEYLAFFTCENLEKITILNQACRIEDGMTISSTESYEFTGTICGYENSTAQAYAEKYGYKFESLGEPPAKESATGDIDGNGQIDATDASLILAEYSLLSTSGTGTFTETMIKSADVNGDGKIDSIDSSAILSYYSYTSTGGTDTIEDFLK